MSFADHFSRQAASYAAFRPVYPDQLGRFLASVVPGRRRVWDCATGSGQATRILTPHFAEVIATDASEAQIRHAPTIPGVTFRTAPAAASGLPDHSCDLVTVAQAAHWFDLEAFYAEVRRVLVPEGIIAVWCYARVETSDPRLNAAIEAFQYRRVGPYWPPGRELVDDQYRSLSFPFETIHTPALAMEARWTRTELLGYISTWSAVARCREVEGVDPMLELEDTVRRLWPDGDAVRLVQWPLSVKVGRIGNR